MHDSFDEVHGCAGDGRADVDPKPRDRCEALIVVVVDAVLGGQDVPGADDGPGAEVARSPVHHHEHCRLIRRGLTPCERCLVGGGGLHRAPRPCEGEGKGYDTARAGVGEHGRHLSTGHAKIVAVSAWPKLVQARSNWRHQVATGLSESRAPRAPALFS